MYLKTKWKLSNDLIPKCLWLCVMGPTVNCRPLFPFAADWLATGIVCFGYLVSRRAMASSTTGASFLKSLMRVRKPE
jgi:hypothetical protein